MTEALSGRVALVTGAASGIGQATARLLAAHGAAVAGLDRSSTTGDALDLVIDLGDTDAIPAAIAEVRQALGPIDIVVNAAGVGVGGPFEGAGSSDEQWRIGMAVNVMAPMVVVRSCLPDLLRNGDGRIVNIASIEGITAARNTSPYTASKHAVVGLTKSLAVELGRSGVTANCICPGPINTGMTVQIPDEHKATFARRHVPIGRYGEPEEVAYVIVALVMPQASYINGAIIPVDGGMTIFSG